MMQHVDPHWDAPITSRELALMAVAAGATPFAIAALLIAVYWLMWPWL